MDQQFATFSKLNKDVRNNEQDNVKVSSSQLDALVRTPTTSRPCHKVRNPFEASLNERLHLPLIGRYINHLQLYVNM